MSRHTLILFVCLVPEALAVTGPLGNPVVRCPNKYTAEGKSLECECYPQIPATSGSRPTDFSLTWPGFSKSSKLKVMNVSRDDNGTVFTCLMTWDGQNRTADYILEVSYGPDDEHTRIHGPLTFITNGSQWLSLTCNATEVNPRPRYRWDGVTCDNNDTNQELCVFKPQPPWDDRREAKCTASSNGGDHKFAITRIRLNLTYPPPGSPEIYGYKTGQAVTKGDKLQCKVSGGKPLVRRVLFSCDSFPLLEDEEDTTLGSSVYSSLTVSSDTTVNFSMVCSCRAIWEPRDDLYSHVTRLVVFVKDVEGTHMDHTKKVQRVLNVAIPLGIIIIVAGIVGIFWVKPRTRQEKTGETTRLPEESPEEVYSEIDITGEEESYVEGCTHPCISTNALTEDVNDDFKPETNSEKVENE